MRKPIKAYLITDPLLYPSNPQDFYLFYKKILTKHKIFVAAYRDKIGRYDLELIKVFLELNREFGVVSLINSSVELGLKCGFDGIHCNSSQFKILPEVKNKFKYVFYSAHSLEELESLKSLKITAATISPIFKMLNKGKPLGVEFLKQALNKIKNLELYALGGIISQKEIESLKKINVENFASIRYFLN
ncbi:MAG: thiamine phosphate synthase [Helicobacter sp.]|nr:thiamine phosphate synthase [Helicobacter sp.]